MAAPMTSTDDFDRAYCGGTATDAQRDAISQFLNSQASPLWRSGRASGKSFLRSAFIRYLEDAERNETP